MASCAFEDDDGTRDFEEAPTGEVSSELVSYDCATRGDTGYTNGKASGKGKDKRPVVQILKVGRGDTYYDEYESIGEAVDLDVYVGDGMHPIVLAQNEGIVIRNRTVWPAAGTGILMVALDWAEVAAY